MSSAELPPSPSHSRGEGRDATAADPRPLIARAREHHRAGRIAAAEELYKEVARGWPGAAEARRLLGVFYARTGRAELALEELGTAQRLAPGNPVYLNDLGHAYLGLERLGEAAEAYRRAIELRPDFADAHYNLGNIQRLLGRLDEAVAAYRRAVAINPAALPAYINLGITLQQLAAFDEAVEALRQATAIDPRSFDAHYNLAVVLATQRRLDEAIEAYRNALLIRPEAASVHLNIGMALQGQDKIDEAIVCFERAIALDPALALAHVNLGAVLYEMGDFPAALGAIRRAIELEPQNALTHVNLAQTLQALGDLPGALAAFRRGLELEPALTTAKAHWSIALQMAGKWDEALSLVDYPALLRTRRLEAVEGWPTVAAFNADLARYICRHPTLMRNPPERATQNGSQTLEILNCDDPEVVGLQRFIEESVREYIATVLAPGTHPFAPPPPAAWRLQGWAVVLPESGYQTPHFHREGVASGVYYVQIPEVVKTGQTGQAGYIKFGPPIDGTPGARSEDTPLSKVIRPEEGMIVLFPAYFWHYTIPFESREERICVAFDVIAEPPPEARLRRRA